MKYILIVLSLLFVVEAQAQRKSRIKKNSNATGTFFGYWGYNRSFYTKSDLIFQGEGYNFTLRGATASDNPSKEIDTYFDFKRITVPQFNARVGYYFKNKYAITFGYDHMKYIFDDRNEVLLDGYIEPGLDQNWSGTYNNEKVITDRNQFHYENSNGLNYLHFELLRTDHLFRARNQRFGISASYGIGAGGLLSYNDFRFAGRDDRVTISMSGYAISGHASLRFEFWNHFFLQGEASGGFMHQTKVRTHPSDHNTYAKQKYGYSMFSTVAGFFLYIRPKNSCNDCPNW